MFLQLTEEVKNGSDRYQGNRDEEERGNPFFFACKDPEGPSGVSQVGEIKESIDHFDGLIKTNPLLDLIFGVLIQRQDKNKANQQHPVFPFHF